MRGKPLLFIPASALSCLLRTRCEGCSPTPKAFQRGCSSFCAPGHLLDVPGLLRERQHNRLRSCDAAPCAHFDWGAPNFWGMRERAQPRKRVRILGGSGASHSDIVLLRAIHLGRDVPALPALPAQPEHLCQPWGRFTVLGFG